MSRQSITDKSNPPKSEWFNGKYRVTPETSKLLQEAVFKDGGTGWAGNTTVSYISRPYIFVYEDGACTFSNEGDKFESHRLPEKQPPQHKKEFKVGKWYKCIERYGRNEELVVGKYYRINELSKTKPTCILNGLCFWWGLAMFDINSESDFNPDAEDLYKHTAYVKFKGYSGKYDSKEYCYKCDDSVFNTSPAKLGGYVYASVDVHGEIKTVQIQRISKDYVDPKATKCIIGIVEEDWYDDVVGTTFNRDDLSGKLTIGYDLSIGKDLSVSIVARSSETNNFKPNDFSITKEDVNMSVQRKSVKVELFDNDQGLPVEYSLVGSWTDYVTEDSDGITVQEIISTGEVADLLQQHNVVRVGLIDEEILTRTGNSVNLRPIKLKNLTWLVDGRKVN